MAQSSNFDTMDLEETFNKAAKHLQTLASQLDSGQLLGFYGLYKQATVGPCDVPKPNWYQTQARHKWEAWKALGDMNRTTAMENYIRALTQVDSTWEDSETTGSQAWVAVSKLSNTEMQLRDVDKTFLDWVKDGDSDKVHEILRKEPILVNVPDEEGLLPIHWAADRGHLPVLKQLIENGANVNAQDENGQTPLHYAVSCSHIETVKYLLSAGATCLEDNDGVTPKDMADERRIIELL